MTDGEMVKSLARIYRLNEKICIAVTRICEEHPNGEELHEALQADAVGIGTNVMSIGLDHLVHPERWEYVNGGTLRYGGRKPTEAGGDDAITNLANSCISGQDALDSKYQPV